MTLTWRSAPDGDIADRLRDLARRLAGLLGRGRHLNGCRSDAAGGGRHLPDQLAQARASSSRTRSRARRAPTARGLTRSDHPERSDRRRSDISFRYVSISSKRTRQVADLVTARSSRRSVRRHPRRRARRRRTSSDSGRADRARDDEREADGEERREHSDDDHLGTGGAGCTARGSADAVRRLEPGRGATSLSLCRRHLVEQRDLAAEHERVGGLDRLRRSLAVERDHLVVGRHELIEGSSSRRSSRPLGRGLAVRRSSAASSWRNAAADARNALRLGELSLVASFSPRIDVERVRGLPTVEIGAAELDLHRLAGRAARSARAAMPALLCELPPVTPTTVMTTMKATISPNAASSRLPIRSSSELCTKHGRS